MYSQTIVVENSEPMPLFIEMFRTQRPMSLFIEMFRFWRLAENVYRDLRKKFATNSKGSTSMHSEPQPLDIEMLRSGHHRKLLLVCRFIVCPM